MAVCRPRLWFGETLSLPGTQLPDLALPPTTIHAFPITGERHRRRVRGVRRELEVLRVHPREGATTSASGTPGATPSCPL
ncbi:hypothetical protein [Nonomuraea dietziae]|uniref:hypothetical protein n=1 Tax=Nonomuraea dietziae TaxID=65515 RepID=UPI0031E37A07